MPRNILIIQGHPDPAGVHLCHVLADAYADGARAAGHQVNQIRLAEIDVPLLRTKEEFESPMLPDSLKAAAEAIKAANHIVLVFPLWLGTMPALVKAFLEQVFRRSVAFEYQKNGFPKKLLRGRSARVVVTMGMPVMLYRWFYFAHGIAGLKRNILHFVGISPVRHTLYGLVEAAGPKRVGQWLDQMRALGRRAA
jgi:putative NADPH-quinone reductase